MGTEYDNLDFIVLRNGGEFSAHLQIGHDCCQCYIEIITSSNWNQEQKQASYAFLNFKMFTVWSQLFSGRNLFWFSNVQNQARISKRTLPPEAESNITL